MRAVLIDASEQIIEERRRLGIDKSDELWQGEWHLVNPPKFWHVELAGDLYAVLRPCARQRGLTASFETGIYRADDDWRVPDLVFARPEAVTERGLTTAELVIEIRSPDDDSYLKLGFYGRVGVAEVLIVHRDRRFELFRRAGEEMRPVDAAGGTVTCETLGLGLATVDGPALRIDHDGELTEV